MARAKRHSGRDAAPTTFLKGVVGRGLENGVTAIKIWGFLEFNALQFAIYDPLNN